MKEWYQKKCFKKNQKGLMIMEFFEIGFDEMTKEELKD